MKHESDEILVVFSEIIDSNLILNFPDCSNRAIGYTTSRDSGNQWRHDIVPSTVRYSVAPSSIVFGRGMNNTYRYYAMHRTYI